MTLLRIIVILAGALALMLAVVILRTETARLHYRISRLQDETGRMHEQLRDANLEIARLRNPMLIRQRVHDVLREQFEVDEAREREREDAR